MLYRLYSMAVCNFSLFFPPFFIWCWICPCRLCFKKTICGKWFDFSYCSSLWKIKCFVFFFLFVKLEIYLNLDHISNSSYMQTLLRLQLNSSAILKNCFLTLLKKITEGLKEFWILIIVLLNTLLRYTYFLIKLVLHMNQT